MFMIRSLVLNVCGAVVCLALVCAGADLRAAPDVRTVSIAVHNTAAITPTNATVGVADPMLGFLSDADMNRQLDLMQSIGVSTLRIDVPWVAVQPNRFGGYDWSKTDRVINAAAARGIAVLGILGQPPQWAAAPGTPALSGQPASASAFATYARAVATRYRGKISAYEIWNEPNLVSFYKPAPDPVAYTALLRAAYPAIKAADRNAIVVGGVLAAAVDTNVSMDPVTFVQRMYAAGAKPYFDAISYHPYQHGLPFSQGGPWYDAPLNQGLRIRQLMIDYGDAAKKIWASEYGVPTSLQDEATQAAFIKDLIDTWRTVDFTGPVFVYTMRDKLTGSLDPEDTFGIFRSDWSAKLAAEVIRQAIAGNPTAMAMVARAAAGDATLADLVLDEPAAAPSPATLPTLLRDALAGTAATVLAVVSAVVEVVTQVVATIAAAVTLPAPVVAISDVPAPRSVDLPGTGSSAAAVTLSAPTPTSERTASETPAPETTRSSRTAVDEKQTDPAPQATADTGATVASVDTATDDTAKDITSRDDTAEDITSKDDATKDDATKDDATKDDTAPGTSTTSRTSVTSTTSAGSTAEPTDAAGASSATASPAKDAGASSAKDASDSSAKDSSDSNAKDSGAKDSGGGE
ncbi:hypothetical protein BEL07_17770 [Mycolicibacterium grossiae]|uniref:Glycoside hydrolase family 5 domain-containing protein n=2 Tax=Mycolicibacterium grossiae TaxID=1552759 RepID=A0A1E8Q389_9MYCO|nr:hypothetical protein BEL07_17770 [Mycolicibacterium grossiae]